MTLNNFRGQYFPSPNFARALAIAALFAASSLAADPVNATRLALQKAKSQAVNQPRAAFVNRETYLRLPEIADVRLSPDGRRLSFLQHNERGVDVMLQDVESGEQKRIIAGLQRAETAWSGDGHRLWVADEQGLAVIESASLSPKRILKWDRRRSQRFWSVDTRAPQHAVIHEKISLNGAEQHRYLNVDAQGKTRLLLECALPLRSALLNPEGNLAFAAAFDGPKYETVVHQFTTSGPREILRCNSHEMCQLVGFNQSEQTLWLLSQRGEDKLALQRWRQESGWETVHRDPEDVVDADSLLWSAARENWLAIAYHGGRRRWYGNDNAARELLAALKSQLPDANLKLSTTNDGNLWLVHAQRSDSAMDRRYLYRPERNQLQTIFPREDATKRIPPLGEVMHPVSYRASDGMLLHGYVLLPSGIAPGKAPIIAWLHGGPITRIYDHYRADMQLLVNRGCVVFVPNFRASTGYGLKYTLSANGDVGNGRVLADIVDGLDFLLAEGIGDRDKQAVMGMSFGGYASLLALSHHPARFRYAFAGAPPTEYGWIKQWQAEHDSDVLRPEGPPLSLLFPQLGFPYQDSAWRKKMQQESPLSSLQALQAPAYIWAGSRDDRVPLKSIVHYVGEARRLNKPLSLLIDPTGGHGPESILGTEACLYQIEYAANRHFGTQLSPASSELREFLRQNLRVEIDSRPSSAYEVRVLPK